ncbi:MAG: hypothetical protein H6909_00740 [Rickettsiaceae bacterium]|nr:hypothetical protein [Rickettsiaceae bacterium]
MLSNTQNLENLATKEPTEEPKEVPIIQQNTPIARTVTTILEPEKQQSANTTSNNIMAFRTEGQMEQSNPVEIEETTITIAGNQDNKCCCDLL